VAYANSIHGPFLLDDHRTIEENESIRHLSSFAGVLHPPAQSPVTGRPLVNLSLAVNYALGGLRVDGFHTVNIAIHILAALALLGFLRRTLPRRAPTGGCPRPMPLVCTLIWALHPLNTETVNYLTQRTESLMALFYLLTMTAAIRALDDPRGRRWQWMACITAFCAVASKETALTLPLMIALWDRAFAFSTFREAWTRRWHLYGLVSASWVVFVVFARELPFFAERGFELQVSRWTYLVDQAPMILQYLKLSVWPASLVFDYGTPQAATLAAIWPFLTVVVILLIVTLVAFSRWPPVGFWGAWFFITLAPASSLIPIPTEVGAERRMYLPLVAVIVLVARAIVWVAATRPRLLTAAAVTASIALGVATVARNRDYQDPLRLWQTVLDRYPHARAHEHHSMYLRDAGHISEAITELKIAAPQSPNARHALASALLEQGDLPGSLAQFRQFIAENPGSTEIIPAREEFAVALRRTGDALDAADQLRAILKIAPGYARAHVALADALLDSHDTSGAIAEYREAIRVQPDNVVALANLGLILASEGDGAEAMTMLQRALTLEPRALPPRKQVIRLLFAQAKYDEMAAEARTLARMAPWDADAHNLLGIALASQHQIGAAGQEFEQALQIDPSNQDAQRNLARAKGLTRRAGE
jgi:tetratricopeptide (TPR) repeat protein